MAAGLPWRQTTDGSISLAATYFGGDDDNAASLPPTIVEERSMSTAAAAPAAKRTYDDFEELMDAMAPAASAAAAPAWREYTFEQLEAARNEYEAQLVGTSHTSSLRGREMEQFMAKRAELAGAGDDDLSAAVPLGRNRIKELFQRGKRALGLSKKAREMKVYGDSNPSAGSFAAGFLGLLDTHSGPETLQTEMGSAKFGDVFSPGRFRTEEQRCSIYVQDKKVRQLLNNSRVPANFYVPHDRDDAGLPGGYNYSIVEYDLRQYSGRKNDKAAKYYGLYKSSLMHMPDTEKKGEDPTYIKGEPIVLNFGNHMGDVAVLPQISGSISSPAMQTKLERRLWYSTGVIARGEPMVVFRFSEAETPKEQTLAFVYMVVPQKDARPGMANLLRAIETDTSTREAAMTALANIAKQGNSKFTKASMLKAGGALADLFVQSAYKSDAYTIDTRVMPVTVPNADAELVDAFTDEFNNLLGYLATLPASSTGTVSLSEDFCEEDAKYVAEMRARGQQQRLACIMSHILFAARSHVLAADAGMRIGLLWKSGRDALGHFSAPSTAVGRKF